MALKSTIFRVHLNVSDLDRPYYGEHALTLARHPSETDQRMMIRLLAFALYADPQLEFGRGLSTEDEPALWQKEYSGEISRWIEVGLPDERILRRAAGRAADVVLLAYGGRALDLWWERESGALARLRNLTVLAIDDATCNGLVDLASRSMQLQATIQDGQIWLTDGAETVSIEPRVLKRV